MLPNAATRSPWPKRPRPSAAASRESAALPGLSAWGRVADYRTGQLAPMPNVADLPRQPPHRRGHAGFGFQHVAIATGATWRRDAVARLHLDPIPTDAAMPIYTPDDLMAGRVPRGG